MLGQTVAAALKVPIYLDSIGTILVGVLAGPIAGAVTGGLANLIWTYVLPAPFHSDFAAPFAIVAVEIGLFAGHRRPARASSAAARTRRWRQARDRRDRRGHRRRRGHRHLRVHAVLHRRDFTFFGDDADRRRPDLRAPRLDRSRSAHRARSSGSSPCSFVRRDLGVAYVAVAGLLCGIVSAIISAPIAAVVFGGVTGSGTDLLVAAFQQAGADLQTAVLQQGLLSDPIDKTLTFFVVFVDPRRPVAGGSSPGSRRVRRPSGLEAA